jgi:ankyrin repeat domain-containing protein 50
MIREDLADEDTAERLPLLHSICEDHGPLELCRQTLEEVKRKLQYFVSLTAITWPWTSEEIGEILDSLEKYKTAIIIALQGDTVKSAHRIQNKVDDIHHHIVHEEKEVQVISWLAKAADPTNNHWAAMGKRTERTGEWFLNSHQFSQWLMPGQSLWLHGIPGAGKTILCSSIIEHVRTRCRSGSNVLCAFFYFDSISGDATKQKVINMISSVLAQLCSASTRVHPAVHRLYEQCQHGTRTASLDEMTETFAKVADGQRIYLILDALDECSECAVLLKTLEKVLHFKHSINLLVTSRKEYDIEVALSRLIKENTSMEDKRVDPDVRIHVEKILQEDPQLRAWDSETKEEISEALVSGAKGMYVCPNYLCC